MKLMSFCWRTIRRRPMRSSLTIFGLSIGIAALVALLSLAGGLEKSWSDVYSARRVDLIVINAKTADFLQSRVPATIIAELKSLPQVLEADGALVDLTSYGGVANTFISGRAYGGFLMEQVDLVEGKGLSFLPPLPPLENIEEMEEPPPPLYPAEREIMVGAAFATGHKKKLGDTVLVEDEPFHIVGIYRASSLFENGGAIVHLQALQRFELRENEVTSIEVQLKNPTDFDAVRAQIRAKYPDLECQKPADMMKQSFGIEIIQAMAWVVSTLALGVGLVGTSNTMLMSVMEQRRQIGLLRALGWKKNKILKLVLGETFLLSIFAYILGSSLGWSASMFLATVEETRNILQPRVDFLVLLQALVAASVLSMLAALYPAWKAMNISPMEALRLP